MFAKKDIKLPASMATKFATIDHRKITTSLQKTSNEQAIIIENIILLWLDSNINESDKECAYSLKKLREVVDTIHTYTNVDKCISFMKNIKNETIFLIISGALGEQIIGNIHDINQIDSIYVFCGNVDKHKQWANHWSKIKGVFCDIRPLCQAVRNDARQTDRDSTSVQFVHANDANYINPTFMYTTLFKEIILEVNYDQRSMDSLVKECSARYENNEQQLKIIQQFKNEYEMHTPVWWYTRECFLHHILNAALRAFEIDIILSMGIFIRDLHRRIEQLHSEQKHRFRGEFTVYRGQGLLKSDFDILTVSRGGFFTFNSFLSTSQQRHVSLNFACNALRKANHVGILFRMIIRSSINRAPFAVLGKESYFKDEEEEVLFSMNCIFRIGHVRETEIQNVFEVELILTTSEIDDQLLQLTKQIRSEINASTALHRMANLLLLLNCPKKAQEFYKLLLDKTSNTDYEELSYLYMKLGIAYSSQGQYDDAIKFLQKAIDIREKFLPRTYLDISICYNALGEAYEPKNENVKALHCFGKSLEIREKFVPEENIQLSSVYMNMGRMHYRLAELPRACEYFTRVLEIRKKCLPSIHPDLAETYHIVGSVFSDIGRDKEALECFQKAYDIFTKSLPSNHNILVRINYAIGLVLVKLGELSQAFEYFENGTKIGEKSLVRDDALLLMCYRGMADLHHTVKNFPKALEYCRKELNLRKKIGLADCLDLAENYDNIGILYSLTGDCTKALEYFEKAIQVKCNLDPPEYDSFASTYENMTRAYQSLGDSSKAIKYSEKFIEMKEKCITTNHPNMIPNYEFILQIYADAKQYAKALQYQQKIHEIMKRTAVYLNSSNLAESYYNMAFYHTRLQQYDDALKCTEESMQIKENLAYLNKEYVISEYLKVGNLCRLMGLYSKSFRWGRKLLDFIKKSLPIDHVTLLDVYQNVGVFYFEMKNYSDALTYWHKELEFAEQISPKNDSVLFTTHYLISVAYFEMGDTSKANATFKKCFDFHKASPGISSNHQIIFCLGNIYYFMSDYKRAIAYYNRTLDIAKIILPETDLFIANVYSEMGHTQQAMGDYNNALLSLQKAIEMHETTFSPRFDLAETYNYMGETHRKMKNYPASLQCFEKALKIQEKFTPAQHPELATTYHYFALVYRDMKQTKQAYSYAQKAVEIAHRWLTPTHPLYVKCKQTLTQLQQKS